MAKENNGFTVIDTEAQVSITKKHLQEPVKTEEKESVDQTKTTQKTVKEQVAPQTQTIEQLLDKVIEGQTPGKGPKTREELLNQLINLIMQMGSDLSHLGTGGIDQRKFANINELQQMGLAHFNYRGEVDGIRYWKHLTEWVLNSSVSIQGMGRRQTIELTQAASGVSPGEFQSKPNILVRGIDRLRGRNWREEAERSGKTPVE